MLLFFYALMLFVSLGSAQTMGAIKVTFPTGDNLYLGIYEDGYVKHANYSLREQTVYF